MNQLHRRFIGPAIERELRNELTMPMRKRSTSSATTCATCSLPTPLSKVVLGLDPAYRTILQVGDRRCDR